MNGGGKFLAVHHEAAITGKADNRRVGQQAFCTHSRRQAITHRARGGGQLGTELSKPVETVQPGSIIAGSIGHNRIWSQPAIQVLHDMGHLQFAWHAHGCRVAPAQVIVMGLLDQVLPASAWLDA